MGPKSLTLGPDQHLVLVNEARGNKSFHVPGSGLDFQK